MTDDLPIGLVARLQPADVEHYVRATGWRSVRNVPGRVRVYRAPPPERRELLIPDNADLGDYVARMSEAVEVIAQAEARSAREVLTELLRVPSDVLRYRVTGPNAEDGFLPFGAAVDIIGACRKSLLASACTVVQPRTYHPRLSRQEAETFLSRCSLGTERGSFVTTVVCPLDAVPDEEAQLGQLSLGFPGTLSSHETFARRVVRTLMESASAIVEAVEEQRLDAILDTHEGDLPISGNLCDALADMEAGAQSALRIEAAWSKYLPTASPLRTVTFEREHFAAARKLADALRPQPPDERTSTFVGLVDSLHGDPGSDKLVGGDIIIRFLRTESDDISRARVALGHADYEIACDAHRDAHYVAITGTLRPEGKRIGRIYSPSNVRDVTKSGP